MAGKQHNRTGTASRLLTLEDMLFRACLLSGYGARARKLASQLAAISHCSDGRSCLDAGAPMQLTVDAPGVAKLRVGIRMNNKPDPASLANLVDKQTLDYIENTINQLPDYQHASIGTWLFWSEKKQSIFIDLRDPDVNDSIKRLDILLNKQQKQHFNELRLRLSDARPWALRIDTDQLGNNQMHLHWVLNRHTRMDLLAERQTPGYWKLVTETLGHLLSRPGKSGRWLIITPLNDSNSQILRVGNSGWTFVPENHNKQRSLSRLISLLEGPRDYAEALWSLCQGTATPGWRVGRACELSISADGIKTRLFYTPQVQPGSVAVTSNSVSADSSIPESNALPVKEYRIIR